MTDERNWRVSLEYARYWLEAGRTHVAHNFVCVALTYANRLSPEHRRATLRILNWTRAAARRETTC